VVREEWVVYKVGEDILLRVMGWCVKLDILLGG